MHRRLHLSCKDLCVVAPLGTENILLAAHAYAPTSKIFAPCFSLEEQSLWSECIYRETERERAATLLLA